MTQTPSAAATDGLPTPRRYLALAAIWIAVTVSVLDSSIANIALPTISTDLGATPAASIWVVNAYQISVAMLLLPIAALGERLGYARIYLAGLIVFACASLACALSTSLTMLSIARFVQGLGGAGVMGMNGALIRFTFPKSLLTRGIGGNAFVVASASAAGPSVAAALLSVASWRWLFAINLPLAVIALACGWRALPRTERRHSRFETVAALLNAATFACVFLVGSDCARGHAGLRTLAEAAAGLIAATLLVRRERRKTAPLLPIDLIAMPALRMAYLTSIMAFAAQMMALVSLPFVLQGRLGLSAVRTGLFITPMAVGTALAAPIAGRLAERMRASILATVGMATMAAGMVGAGLLAARVDGPASPAEIWVPAALALAGIGFGLYQTPNNRTMLTAAPPARSGAAAGMLATMRIIGQTTGAVIVALVLRLSGSGSPMALYVSGSIAAAAAILGIIRTAAG